jgi:hypothetical protein
MLRAGPTRSREIGMHMDSPDTALGASAPMGNNDLAEGLMLLRATTLKIIRLQLAMDRQDRRVAFESVDDLVMLDRQLRDHLATTTVAEKHRLFHHALESERAMMNLEKLALGAEVQRRPAAAIVEQVHAGIDDAWLGPRDLPIQEEPPTARRRNWLILFPLAASIAAVTAATTAHLIGFIDTHSWLSAVGL